MSRTNSTTTTAATYAYPGAPVCLTDPRHICAYVCAVDVYTRNGIVVVDTWHDHHNSRGADEAIARYLAHSRLFAPKNNKEEGVDMPPLRDVPVTIRVPEKVKRAKLGVAGVPLKLTRAANAVSWNARLLMLAFIGLVLGGFGLVARRLAM